MAPTTPSLGYCRYLVGGLDDCSVAISSILNPLAVDTRRTRGAEPALSGLFPAVVVDVLDVEGVQVAREVAAMMGRWTLVLARARGAATWRRKPKDSIFFLLTQAVSGKC